MIHARVESKVVEHFLWRLKPAGIEPDEVSTGGSPLYPGALKEIWPEAAHQLCLFHDTRLVSGEIYEAQAALRAKVARTSTDAPMSVKAQKATVATPVGW